RVGGGTEAGRARAEDGDVADGLAPADDVLRDVVERVVDHRDRQRDEHERAGELEEVEAVVATTELVQDGPRPLDEHRTEVEHADLRQGRGRGELPDVVLRPAPLRELRLRLLELQPSDPDLPE